MYRIYCDGILLFDDSVDDLILSDLKLEMELNKTGSFTFTIYPDHAAYSLIKKLKSIINVYQEGSLLFKGRVFDDEIGFHNEKQVICEGELAFLLDSVQRPYDYSGTLEGYFTMLVNQHNAHVEASKRFTVGNITVKQGTTTFSRKETDYMNTWDSIQKKLIETHGGYISIRHVGNVNFIDYLSDFNVLSTQEITFGKNLLDMKLKRSGEDIATAVIPLGAKIEGTDERLTIKSVNNDVDYVSNEEAVQNYGTIFKTVVFDDISSASDLKVKGIEYLSQQVLIVNSLDLSAADLATIDKTVNSFRIGTYVRVTTEPHSIDQNFLVDKISINLLNPTDNKLTLGTRFLTLTEKQNSIKFIKGDSGVPGKDGEDGMTSYLHIKYSNDGQTFTGNNGEDVGAWIGTLVDFTQTDSLVFSDYTWKKYTGDVGGRNLIPNTRSMSGYVASSNVSVDNDIEGFAVATFATTALGWNSVQTREPIPLSIVRGKQVTFSFLVRTDDAEEMTAYEYGLIIGIALCTATSYARTKYRSQSFYKKQMSTEWEKITWTATLTDDFFSSGTGTIEDDTRLYLQIYDYSPYSMQVKQIKLEFGNVATDWSPSFDDIPDNEQIVELEKRVNSSIQQNADSILHTVSEEYYLKDSADALVSEINTKFEQTSQSFEFQFNELSKDIDDVAAGADASFTEIRKYIRFENGNIILGESGNELTLRIENDRISFLDNNLEVAYFSNEKLYVTDGEFMNSLQLGKFAFYPRPNGNLSFGKVV